MDSLAELLRTPENQHHDKKSLQSVLGRQADWGAIAKDCVAFANASGGMLLIGVEDDANAPAPGQRIDPALVDRTRKRIGELTINVQPAPELATADNGGQLIVLHIPRSIGVASTSSGQYFLRVGDQSQPVLGDDVLRLATERPQTPWETLTSLQVPREHVDASGVATLTSKLRASPRVKPSVREKSDAELLDHYGLADGPWLTNLGILLVGWATDRTRVGSAPIVQAIRFDADGVKIDKIVWDDHSLSPVQLIDAIWETVPDFRERYELPEGMLRTEVPAYEEVVVRELLVNALVHRPYTQRGDIYLNLHPDRLEVVNPGRLPLGVTPANILHQSRRRNDGLARIFHDLGLMEREGSGFDTMYERLLSTGRGAPVASEGIDSVHVVVPRRVIHPGVARMLAHTDQAHQLTQRERIALGLLAQTEGLTSAELVQRLGLPDTIALRAWLGNLVALGLVQQTGRTRATRYFVPSDLLRSTGLDERTTLTRIEPHRIKALVLEDLGRYPGSSSTDIRQRTGPEIPTRSFSRVLKGLVDDGQVLAEGKGRWRVYRLSSIGQSGDPGR